MTLGVVASSIGYGCWRNNDGREDVDNGIEIDNREDCESANGVWKRWGLLPVESCNIRANDFGERCYNSSECEGLCLLERCLDDECRESIGACSEFRRVYGCFATREEDGIYHVCVD